MDHYAADAARGGGAPRSEERHPPIGHSTGGGEATRYVARHGQKQGRVAKLVLIGAVPPIMLKTGRLSGGACPCRSSMSTCARRSRPTAPSSTSILPSGPFYSFNRPGAKVSQGVIQNWWRQGMHGGGECAFPGYFKAFSETDFTEDLKTITVPTLVMHGDDDQIVPIAQLRIAVGEAAEERRAEGFLREVLPARHECTTHADVVNPDLLAFIKGGSYCVDGRARRSSSRGLFEFKGTGTL